MFAKLKIWRPRQVAYCYKFLIVLSNLLLQRLFLTALILTLRMAKSVFYISSSKIITTIKRRLVVISSVKENIKNQKKQVWSSRCKILWS